MKSSQYFSSKMILGLVVVLLQVSERSVAEDWPNWMGPNLDNVWNIAKPPQSLPSGSLKAKWTATRSVAKSCGVRQLLQTDVFTFAMTKN